MGLKNRGRNNTARWQWGHRGKFSALILISNTHIIPEQEPKDIKIRVDKSVLINQGEKIRVEKSG